MQHCVECRQGYGWLCNTMQSPSSIGSILIITSIVALASPLISLGVHFLDLSLPRASISISTLTDWMGKTELSPPSSMIPPQLISSSKTLLSVNLPCNNLHCNNILSATLSTTFISLAGGTIAFIFQTISQIVRLLPQMVSSVMCLNLGMCAGYVGMVHLNFIRPDEKRFSL